VEVDALLCVKKELRLAELAEQVCSFRNDNNDKQSTSTSTSTSQLNREHHDSINDRSSPVSSISSLSAALMRVETTPAGFRDVHNAGQANHHQANG